MDTLLHIAAKLQTKNSGVRSQNKNSGKKQPLKPLV